MEALVLSRGCSHQKKRHPHADCERSFEHAIALFHDNTDLPNQRGLRRVSASLIEIVGALVPGKFTTRSYAPHIATSARFQSAQRNRASANPSKPRRLIEKDG
jgi:hypothetical protein